MCVSATLRSNISETKGDRGSVTIVGAYRRVGRRSRMVTSPMTSRYTMTLVLFGVGQHKRFDVWSKTQAHVTNRRSDEYATPSLLWIRCTTTSSCTVLCMCTAVKTFYYSPLESCSVSVSAALAFRDVMSRQSAKHLND